MNVFAQMFKSMSEKHNGKIRWYTARWVYEPTEKQIKKAQENRPEYIKLSTAQSDSGKMTTLISESGVHCYNKDLWPDHPQFKDTYRCIPRSLCRKCEFYRKGGYDRIKYPHCDWLRKERGGDKGAAKEIIGLVNKAVKETERIMM